MLAILQALVVNGIIGTIPKDDELTKITNPLAAEVYTVDRVFTWQVLFRRTD